ncbi:MAG: putative 2-dehydropantoate 2-reductase [Verrucomicrobiota bacterium]
MPLTYAIIGTGALGGFYGCRLQRAGCEVHFLIHSDYEHVVRHGLVCDSKDGNFTLPKVHVYRAAKEMPACDVVIVALKATQNHLLPNLLPAAGAVLLMQNGLGGEELIAGLVGPDRVVSGLSFLCSNRVGPGHIRHLDYCHVALGEFATRSVSNRLRAIAVDFERAGIPVQLLDDFRVARWNKLVWNIPYNGLSVILNATTAELMAQTSTRQLCEQLMWEIVADARTCGVPVEDTIVAKLLNHTEKMTPYRTSMKIDFDEHRPMEVEAIYGNPLRAAQAAGAKSPLVETIYRQLTFLDAANRRSAIA